MQPFNVYILGCGSALPTLHHCASSQVVEIRDKLFMIDCGEGTQTQLRRSRLRHTRLGHIFISHLHGDHCFGLIGLVSTFGLVGRNAPLHIFAPGELEAPLKVMMDLFCRGLGYQVLFHAVTTTVSRVVYEDSYLTIETIPLEHSIPCCGYLFREKAPQPHLRGEAIKRYNIPLSEIDAIKGGKDFITSDGTVIPWQSLTTPAETARSYAYCSDTRYIPTLHEIVRGVSVLYHESTYADNLRDRAALYFHSTASDAARVARDAGVGKLILGHFSKRYENDGIFLEEARKIFKNTALANEMEIFNVENEKKR